MITFQDGVAQKFAELVITNDQLNQLEAKQRESYSQQRLAMIRERRKKLESLTNFLYPEAVKIHHSLLKTYPTPKMIEIGGLIHG